MNEYTFFQYLLWIWFGLAFITFFFLFFVTAPYGRYARKGWGPRISSVFGWIAMELPSPLVFSLCFILGTVNHNLVGYAFFVIWMSHYLHRSLIYPLQLRGSSRQWTLVPVLLGIIFNLGNAYLNGRFLYSLGPSVPTSWLLDLRFSSGMLLFAIGFVINKQSDRILNNLRKPNETGYQIPYGGFYRWVSCPNYLGEILEWFGWALLCFNVAGLSFALWTVANLLPRAWAHHRWYKNRFPDYPKERRAIIPFLL